MGRNGIGPLAFAASVYPEIASFDPHQHTNLGFTQNARIDGTQHSSWTQNSYHFGWAGIGAGFAVMETVLQVTMFPVMARPRGCCLRVVGTPSEG